MKGVDGARVLSLILLTLGAEVDLEAEAARSSSSSSLWIAAARSLFLAVGVLMRMGLSFFGFLAGLALGGGAGADEGGTEFLGLLPSFSLILGVLEEGVGIEGGCDVGG